MTSPRRRVATRPAPSARSTRGAHPAARRHRPDRFGPRRIGRDAAGLRGVEQVERVSRRGDPCGRCVEGGADVAERQEHLGREHEHEEPRRKGQVAGHQPEPDRDGDEGHREAGRELECEAREEGDPQHLHRARAVVVGDGRIARSAARPRRTRPGHRPPTTSRNPRDSAARLSHCRRCTARGGHADERHEDRDERQHDHEHETRQRVGDPRGHDAHRRRHRGEHELRQVAPEVLVQRVEAGPEQRRDAGVGKPGHRPGAVRAPRAARAQLRLHAHRAGRADEVPQPGREGTSGCRDDEQYEERPRLRHPHAVDEPRDERARAPTRTR